MHRELLPINEAAQAAQPDGLRQPASAIDPALAIAMSQRLRGGPSEHDPTVTIWELPHGDGWIIAPRPGHAGDVGAKDLCRGSRTAFDTRVGEQIASHLK